MNLEILHIIPTHVLSSKIYGSFKDVWGRQQYFKDSMCNYQIVTIESDEKYEDVLVRIMLKPSHIFIEYSYYSKLIRGIRKKYPMAHIAVRAHNLEAMQHYDNHGFSNPKGLLWLLYGMARYFYADIICKFKADYIFPISEWEANRYWRYIPGKAKVKWLPYFSPDFVVSNRGWDAERRNIVACLPTSNENRKSKDLVNRFISFSKIAQEVTGPNTKLRYVMTGDLSSWSMGKSKYVEYSGMVDDLSEFMGQVRVVCMLSPLGYGFKTTITDAVSSGCRVIISTRLYHRLPLELQSVCLPLEGFSTESISAVIDEILKVKSVGDIGERLKSKALLTLKEDFIQTEGC